MQFLKAAAAGAIAFASIVAAQTTLAFTNVPTSVTAGQPATIQYAAQDLSQPATITLRKGDPSNLDIVSVLTSNALNGSYIWIPSKSLPNASDYALQITVGSQINYSGQLSLTGADVAAVSSALSASSSSVAAASSLTASVVSSIESIIASYNGSLANLTAPVILPTSPPTPPANITAVAPSVGTGVPIHRNTTLVSPTLRSSSSASGSSQSSSSAAGTSSSSRASSGASSTSASASPSSTGAAATLTQASTSVLGLVAVAAIFFFQ